MRSTSFTSGGGEVSPRAVTPAGSAARVGSATLSHRTSRSGEDDSSAVPDVASTASGPGHNPPAGMSAAEDRPPHRRGGRSVAAASEAGSVDAASIATERGSEAVLGDVEDGAASAAGLRLEPMPERDGDAAEPDAGARTSAGGDSEPVAGQAAGSSRDTGADKKSSPSRQEHDSSVRAASHPSQAATSSDAGSSEAGRHADYVEDPLRGAGAESASNGSAAAAEPGFSGKQIRVDRTSEAGSADGQGHAELCTPTHGDIGHLPVARTTPDRALSQHSDRGHMTATSSQVCGSRSPPLVANRLPRGDNRSSGF